MVDGIPSTPRLQAIAAAKTKAEAKIARKANLPAGSPDLQDSSDSDSDSSSSSESSTTTSERKERKAQHLHPSLEAQVPSASSTPKNPLTTALTIANISATKTDSTANANKLSFGAPSPEKTEPKKDPTPEDLDEQPIDPRHRKKRLSVVGISPDSLTPNQLLIKLVEEGGIIKNEETGEDESLDVVMDNPELILSVRQQNRRTRHKTEYLRRMSLIKLEEVEDMKKIVGLEGGGVVRKVTKNQSERMRALGKDGKLDERPSGIGLARASPTLEGIEEGGDVILSRDSKGSNGRDSGATGPSGSGSCKIVPMLNGSGSNEREGVGTGGSSLGVIGEDDVSSTNTEVGVAEPTNSLKSPPKRERKSTRLANAVRGVSALRKIGSIFSQGKQKTQDRESEETLKARRQNVWDQLCGDHLPGAEPQLRRFLRWKDDYAYFLKTEKKGFNQKTLTLLLTKRGDCRCALNGQNCGPLDPYEYDVLCKECDKLLPPFADQMVAMDVAIGQPNSSRAHKNVLALELEEETALLQVQHLRGDDRDDVDVGSPRKGGRHL